MSSKVSKITTKSVNTTTKSTWAIRSRCAKTKKPAHQNSHDYPRLPTMWSVDRKSHYFYINTPRKTRAGYVPPPHLLRKETIHVTVWLRLSRRISARDSIQTGKVERRTWMHRVLLAAAMDALSLQARPFSVQRNAAINTSSTGT